MGVQPFRILQLFMGARLADLTVFQHTDSVHTNDRGQR